MAELTTDISTCCTPEDQTVCCEPAEKSACCGTAASGGSCGCAGGVSASETTEDIRELVRDRYATAARSMTETRQGLVRLRAIDDDRPGRPGGVRRIALRR